MVNIWHSASWLSIKRLFVWCLAADHEWLKLRFRLRCRPALVSPPWLQAHLLRNPANDTVLWQWSVNSETFTKWESGFDSLIFALWWLAALISNHVLMCHSECAICQWNENVLHVSLTVFCILTETIWDLSHFWTFFSENVQVYGCELKRLKVENDWRKAITITNKYLSVNIWKWNKIMSCH